MVAPEVRNLSILIIFIKVIDMIMISREFENHRITFKKARAKFRSAGLVKECFYHDKTQCSDTIVQSHSIQRNKRLSIIEGDVNGQNFIYTFTDLDFDSDGSLIGLTPIGKKISSRFFGFCNFHDASLFFPVENNEFDDSSLHCFLHSYRSFAHSYHIKKQSLNSSKAENIDRVSIDLGLMEMIFFTQTALKDLETSKKVLDEMIQNKRYDGLEYLTYMIPEKFPIACASIINPEYSYKNKSLNKNPNKSYSMVMLTILPDVDKTILIFACFPDDEKGKLLIDELSNLSKYPLPFEKAVSSILINNAENTFFSPSLWNALGTNGQKQLCIELENMINKNPSSFVHSKINFFDKKFSASRLSK